MERWRLIAGLAILGPLLRAQSGESLLRQVEESFRSAETYQFESVTESELTSDLQRFWSKSHDILARNGPNRLLFESISNGGSYLVVSNGEWIWRAIPDFRAFVRMPLTGPLLDFAGGGHEAEASMRMLKLKLRSFSELSTSLIKVDQLRREKVPFAGKLTDCVVVRGEYSPPKGSTRIESLTRSFWIDPRRRVVLREEDTTRGHLLAARPYERAEDKHTTQFITATIGEPVAASLFTYSPPATFREVTSLERVNPQATKEMIGKEAPVLSLRTLGGEMFEASALHGKIVLLDFWASWCEPCRGQLPTVAKLYQDLKGKDVVVLGINDDESPEAALRFLSGKEYKWPSLYDGKTKEARAKYKVEGIPTLVVVDRQGIIRAYEVGGGDIVDRAIRAVIKELGVALP